MNDLKFLLYMYKYIKIYGYKLNKSLVTIIFNYIINKSTFVHFLKFCIV